MENQAGIIKKSIMLNFGLILGFVSIIIQLLNYVFGDIYEPHWGLMVVSFAVTTVVIILGIKKLKEGQDGLLSLGEAIKTGLGIALISAIVYSIYLVLFVNVIEPEFFARIAQIQEQTIIDNYPELSDEQLESAIGNAAMFNSIGVHVTMTLIFSLFFGLIISLIGGLVMKKEENE